MSKQSLEPARVFIGDPHCGSPRGLTNKPQNDGQEWLLETWANLKAHVFSSVKGCEFVLMLGGDMVDQPGKPNRDIALEMFEPLAKKASAVYGVPGTEYHVGPDGEEDREIYADLGAKGENVRHVHPLKIGGKILWWAHHLNQIGGTPWNEFDGLYRSAKKFHYIAIDNEEPAPDLCIGHHVHKSPGVAVYKKTSALVCPAFQLGTPFGAKIRPFSIPSIGCVVWKPESNYLEIKTYPIPPKHRSP